MADLNLITYTGSLVTPQHDALMNNAELVANGMFYGGEITAKDSTTLHITQGIGHVYGREFEITTQDIAVGLAPSGELLGRVYIHIDLSNTSNPAQLLVVTGSELPDLEDNPDININNGSSDMELCTFIVNTTTIGGIVETVNRNLSVHDLTRINGALHIDEEKQRHLVISGTDEDYAVIDLHDENEEYQTGLRLAKNEIGNTYLVSDSRHLYIGTDRTDNTKQDGTSTESVVYMRTDKNAQKDVIRAYGGNNDGIGVMICGGGTTIIGAGESAYQIRNNNIENSADGGVEALILAADTEVNIFSNCNDINNRQRMVLNTNGNLWIPDNLVFNRNNSAIYLKEYLKDMIIARDFSISNVSVTKDSGKTVSIPMTIPNGYKYVCVVEVITTGFVAHTAYQSRSGNNLSVYLHGLANGSGTVRATVLFIRNVLG